MAALTQTGRKQAGFTYMAMLMAIVILGIMLSAAGSVWQLQAKREKEAELLFIGNQFRRALLAYYSAVPNQPTFPTSLEELLEDRRNTSKPRRHLRRIYTDPFTNKAEWGVEKLPDKRIIGIYSLSGGVPLKRANFPQQYASFENAQSYRDWKFSLTPNDAQQGKPQQTLPGQVNAISKQKPSN